MSVLRSFFIGYLLSHQQFCNACFCSKRIDPDKENVNEITPRRSRSKRSSDAAESSKDVENLLQLSPTEPKQALGHREYQMTFNNLETQRQMDLSQIDSEKSYKLLAKNYNL